MAQYFFCFSLEYLCPDPDFVGLVVVVGRFGSITICTTARKIRAIV